MSSPRIHRDKLEETIRRSIKLTAARLALWNNKSAAGETIYKNVEDIVSDVTNDLLASYAVSRKPRTERVVKS